MIHSPCQGRIWDSLHETGGNPVVGDFVPMYEAGGFNGLGPMSASFALIIGSRQDGIDFPIEALDDLITA
jgi:hypothetical protein